MGLGRGRGEELAEGGFVEDAQVLPDHWFKTFAAEAGDFQESERDLARMRARSGALVLGYAGRLRGPGRLVEDADKGGQYSLGRRLCLRGGYGKIGRHQVEQAPRQGFGGLEDQGRPGGEA